MITNPLIPEMLLALEQAELRLALDTVHTLKTLLESHGELIRYPDGTYLLATAQTCVYSRNGFTANARRHFPAIEGSTLSPNKEGE